MLLRDDLLLSLPGGLRTELVDAFTRIVVNFRESRWEPSELNGGKLCEVVYTIIRGMGDGRYPPKARKPRNMLDACRQLETEAALPRSLRVQVPRVLAALYEIRNNRGVGHVGGDVDPNHMDAVAVLAMAKWVVAELVRVFHGVPTDEAALAIDALVEREIPAVWDTGSVKRVLVQRPLKEQMLLLLYAQPGPVCERDLLAWVERSRSASSFRRDVLRPAHRARQVEYDETGRTVLLSPLGAKYVEENLRLVV